MLISQMCAVVLLELPGMVMKWFFQFSRPSTSSSRFWMARESMYAATCPLLLSFVVSRTRHSISSAVKGYASSFACFSVISHTSDIKFFSVTPGMGTSTWS